MAQYLIQQWELRTDAQSANLYKKNDVGKLEWEYNRGPVIHDNHTIV